MFKRFRIIIPLALVLVSVVVFVLAKQCRDEGPYISYCVSAQHLVTNLNFPLLVILAPLGYVVEWLAGLLRLSPEESRVGSTAVILPGIALFWYYVVAEVDLRLHGKSLMQFSGWITELVKVIVLFCAGAGAIVYACIDTGRRLLLLSHIGGTAVGMILVLLPALVLVIWGIVLVGLSVHDFAVFLKRRPNS